jgi:hypothetical protein
MSSPARTRTSRIVRPLRLANTDIVNAHYRLAMAQLLSLVTTISCSIMRL